MKHCVYIKKRDVAVWTAIGWTKTVVALDLQKSCVRMLHTSTGCANVGHALQSQQLRVDLLLGFLKDANQIPSLVAVGVGEKRVCSAGVGCPACATDTMHVILRTVWEVVVDDKLHILHVCTQQTFTLD